MSDSQFPLDYLSLTDLRAARNTLYLAIVTGAKSTRFADGSSVEYRDMAEALVILRGLDARISTYLPAPSFAAAPLRAYIMRPWNGYS